MKDNSIKDIFDEAYKRELSGSDNSPEHKFSFSHKRKMKKIFRLYDKNTAVQPDTAAHKSAKRLTVAVVLIIVLLALSAVSVIAVYSAVHKQHSDHYDMLVIDRKSGQDMIKYVYELADHTVDFRSIDKDNCFTVYKTDLGDTVLLEQTVKINYTNHNDNENGAYSTVYIGDIPAVYISSDDDFGTLLWDNGDYVMEITGHMTKNELINSAKSLKISEIENNSSQNQA